MTQFSYTAPTTNTDGSAIGAIQKYEIGYGSASKTYTAFVTDATIEAASAQVTSANIAPGSYFSAVRAYAKDAQGVVTASGWSNEVSFSVSVPVPSAPTSFTAA